jgi:hypothetical protein
MYGRPFPWSAAAVLVVWFQPSMVSGAAAVPANDRPPPQVTMEVNPLLVLFS